MGRTKNSSHATSTVGIGKVLKRSHYPLDVILLCVRWYVAYSLSLRNLEEVIAERGIEVDHSSVHRWVIKLVPLIEKAFRRIKRPAGKSWRMDETYVKVKGHWKYLYRAVDKEGNTVDFLLRAHRDKAPARRYYREGDCPERRARNCHRGQEWRQSGRARNDQHRAGDADHDPAEQVAEQYRRAGSPSRQTHRQADDGLQEFPVRTYHSVWH
ncbi:DDE domain-containing protein [Paraburkholderia unamae]|nr:DDE domain-containing protein [Paraburkholderia unamae]